MNSTAKSPAALIYNPAAGRRRHAERLEALRRILGEKYQLRVEPTAVAGDAVGAARDAAARGDAVAFAWGGDGTFREVCEGILGSETALGTIPGGTTNVVPRAIGLSGDPLVAATRLLGARAELRDAGVLRGSVSGVVVDQPFLMQATAGLDAFLMRSVRAEVKARHGFLGMLVEGARLLPKYAFPAFRVVVDGGEFEVTGAGFANLAEYAGPFHYVPGAHWRDGVGHALLYRGRTHAQAIWFALMLGLGRHTRLGTVTTCAAATFAFPETGTAGAQFDGDVWRGTGAASCRIAPRSVRVLLPEGSSA